MAIIIVLSAFILCWTWIELTIFILKFQNKTITSRRFNKKFIWYLRFIALSLLIISFIYMYFFKQTQFQEVIQYCFGIIK